MASSRLSASEIQRLAHCRRDYEALKTTVADVGFICEGSLNTIRTACGNPNCRCADPRYRHGPYHQLTWKEAGTTVTRRLSAEEARLYREWIANRRKLARLVERMQRLSRQAGTYMLGELGRPFQGPTRSRRRSARRRN